MRKKSWEKPELIVLARSHPEEAILSACKTIVGTNFHYWYNGCWNDLDGDYVCDRCASTTGS